MFCKTVLFISTVVVALSGSGCITQIKHCVITAKLERGDLERQAFLYFHQNSPAQQLLDALNQDETSEDDSSSGMGFVKNAIEGILGGVALSGGGADYEELFSITQAIYNPAKSGVDNLQAIVDSPKLQQFVRDRLVQQAPFSEMTSPGMDKVIQAAVKHYSNKIDQEGEAWAQGRIGIVLPSIKD